MLGAGPDAVDRPEAAPLDAFGAMPVRAQTPALGAGKGGLNGLGYQPKPQDYNTLARMIYAEGSNTPEDYGALGWSMVNRIGQREFGGSLDGLTRRPREYSFSPNAKQPHGSARWVESANPATLTGPAAASWKRAEATAKGILDGQVRDPTGGATFFFSSDSYDGRPETAMGPWYQGMLRDGALVPSPYQSGSRLSTKNYFFKVAPPKPAR